MLTHRLVEVKNLDVASRLIAKLSAKFPSGPYVGSADCGKLVYSIEPAAIFLDICIVRVKVPNDHDAIYLNQLARYAEGYRDALQETL